MYENSLYFIKPDFNYLDCVIQLIVVMRMKIQKVALVRYMTNPSTHTHTHTHTRTHTHTHTHTYRTFRFYNIGWMLSQCIKQCTYTLAGNHQAVDTRPLVNVASLSGLVKGTRRSEFRYWGEKIQLNDDENTLKIVSQVA